MEIFIKDTIVQILESRKDMLKMMVRQKFELAHRLELAGMDSVEIEAKMDRRRDFHDLSFFSDGNLYRVELKTPNTNWQMPGVKNMRKPVTKNIQSIIADAKKLNSRQGIIAFVLFPIPPKDNRWLHYIDRISRECEIDIDRNNNCHLVTVSIDGINYCELLVCSFKSRTFSNWF